MPDADLSGKDFSGTSLKYANLDNVNFTGADFSHCNLSEVRIEETTPVQSIAVSPGEDLLVLYHDGIIRQWNYQRRQRPEAINLSGSIATEEMKLFALPGSGLTLVDPQNLFFYDRDGSDGKKLKLKAHIEVKPSVRVIKVARDSTLLIEETEKQKRLILVDLKKQAIVQSIDSLRFTLCDHLDYRALVIFNEKEELRLIDTTMEKRASLTIPTEVKVSCLTTCKCKETPGRYLLGLGLYNGAVQILPIDVENWKIGKLSQLFCHQQPVKDILFVNNGCIVSGGLDRTIQVIPFNPDGQPVGAPKECKMTLLCKGMKIEGVIREKEKKLLRQFIDRAERNH